MGQLTSSSKFYSECLTNTRISTGDNHHKSIQPSRASTNTSRKVLSGKVDFGYLLQEFCLCDHYYIKPYVAEPITIVPATYFHKCRILYNNKQNASALLLVTIRYLQYRRSLPV